MVLSGAGGFDQRDKSSPFVWFFFYKSNKYMGVLEYIDGSGDRVAVLCCMGPRL